MKNRIIKFGLIALMFPLFTGCELIGDAVEAGVSIGIFIGIAVVVAIIWIVYKLRK